MHIWHSSRILHNISFSFYTLKSNRQPLFMWRNMIYKNFHLLHFFRSSKRKTHEHFSASTATPIPYVILPNNQTKTANQPGHRWKIDRSKEKENIFLNFKIKRTSHHQRNTVCLVEFAESIIWLENENFSFPSRIRPGPGFYRLLLILLVFIPPSDKSIFMNLRTKIKNFR